MRAGCLKFNPSWNLRGPYIPAWFKIRLRRIDPDLVVQYIPPRSIRDPRGVDPTLFPMGLVDICKKLKNSQMLHPRCTWSLQDICGNFAPPGMDTINLIQRAYDLQRRGRMDIIEDAFENAISQINKDKACQSRDDLRESIRKFASVTGRRQWTNRVYLRRDYKEHSSDHRGTSGLNAHVPMSTP